MKLLSPKADCYVQIKSLYLSVCNGFFYVEKYLIINIVFVVFIYVSERLISSSDRNHYIV